MTSRFISTKHEHVFFLLPPIFFGCLVSSLFFLVGRPPRLFSPQLPPTEPSIDAFCTLKGFGELSSDMIFFMNLLHYLKVAVSAFQHFGSQKNVLKKGQGNKRIYFKQKLNPQKNHPQPKNKWMVCSSDDFWGSHDRKNIERWHTKSLNFKTSKRLMDHQPHSLCSLHIPGKRQKINILPKTNSSPLKNDDSELVQLKFPQFFGAFKCRPNFRTNWWLFVSGRVSFFEDPSIYPSKPFGDSHELS